MKTNTGIKKMAEWVEKQNGFDVPITIGEHLALWKDDVVYKAHQFLAEEQSASTPEAQKPTAPGSLMEELENYLKDCVPLSNWSVMRDEIREIISHYTATVKPTAPGSLMEDIEKLCHQLRVCNDKAGPWAALRIENLLSCYNPAPGRPVKDGFWKCKYWDGITKGDRCLMHEKTTGNCELTPATFEPVEDGLKEELKDIQTRIGYFWARSNESLLCVWPDTRKEHMVMANHFEEKLITEIERLSHYTPATVKPTADKWLVGELLDLCAMRRKANMETIRIFAIEEIVSKYVPVKPKEPPSPAYLIENGKLWAAAVKEQQALYRKNQSLSAQFTGMVDELSALLKRYRDNFDCDIDASYDIEDILFRHLTPPTVEQKESLGEYLLDSLLVLLDGGRYSFHASEIRQIIGNYKPRPSAGREDVEKGV